MRRGLLLLPLLLLAGRAGAQTPAARPIPDDDFAKVMTLFDRMSAVAQQDRGNCDRLAADLTNVVSQNQQELDRIKDLKRQGYEPTDQQRDQLDAVAQRLQPITSACAENPNMQALQRHMRGR